MRAGLVAVLTLFAACLAVALFASSAGAGGGELDAGGTPGTQLVASEEFPSELLKSGEVLPIRVRVVDQYGAPIKDVEVTADADGATIVPRSARTDASGVVRFTLTATVTEAREFTVTISTSYPAAIPDVDTLQFVAVPAPPPRLLARPETAIGASVGAAFLAALATTEFGKYGLSNLIVFPLYSRLKREEVLDHFVRGQIYGYVMSHPGEHYNSLKEALKVTNGTLAHHLRTLEMQGFIKSDRDGIFKRFYPIEMQVPRDRGIRLSDLQHHLLRAIRGDAGPTQQDLALQLSVSQQTISYNLRHLSREGLVRMEKDGRAKRYFPLDT